MECQDESSLQRISIVFWAFPNLAKTQALVKSDGCCVRFSDLEKNLSYPFPAKQLKQRLNQGVTNAAASRNRFNG